MCMHGITMATVLSFVDLLTHQLASLGVQPMYSHTYTASLARYQQITVPITHVLVVKNDVLL